MICPNCSKTVEDLSRFCTHCGYEFKERETGIKDAHIPSESDYDLNDRQGTLDYLDYIERCYGSMTAYFDRLIELNELKKQYYPGKKLPFYAWIVAGGVALLLLLLSLSFSIVLALPLFIAGFGITILVFYILGSRASKANLEEYKKRVAEIEAEEDDIYDTINRIYNNDPVLRGFPRKYFSDYVIGQLKDILQSRRADSLKECINIYEQDKHFRRLEKSQEEIISFQQTILDAAFSTVVEVRTAKKAEITAAVFNKKSARKSRKNKK